MRNPQLRSSTVNRFPKDIFLSRDTYFPQRPVTDWLRHSGVVLATQETSETAHLFPDRSSWDQGALLAVLSVG
jgi:hypothetical protein